MVGLQVGPSLRGDVLRALHGVPQGLVAAGDESGHPRLGHAEGRGKLAGVQHAQPSARSGAQVEQPAAPLHARLDGFHQGLYLRDGSPDRLGHPMVLFVDVPEQFAGRHTLQMVEMGGLFGNFLLGFHCCSHFFLYFCGRFDAKLHFFNEITPNIRLILI